MSRVVIDELRQAIVDCTDRGMVASAKWAAEHMMSVLQSGPGEQNLGTAPRQALATTPNESDLLLTVKPFYDMKEYHTVVRLLDAAGTEATNSRARFLRFNSLYLAGEKRRTEEVHETSEQQTSNQVVNRNLRQLHTEMEELESQHLLDSDGFLLYLYGVVLKQLEDKVAAKKMLARSVSIYPCCWGAWTELAALCNEDVDGSVEDMLAHLQLPRQHWIFPFFAAHFGLEIQQSKGSQAIYAGLRQRFPSSNYLLLQEANTLYNMREFESAAALFEELLERDPHRIEGMDTYSNVLYVQEDTHRLSYLAQTANRTDKFRPETCCIIGNYYSMKAEHEKAVLYFRRAIRLNPQYLAAWTLMGHEYVEMKNPQAAIEAYRRAVDINPRDYRAWYGLGQTYEIMSMPFYALHYYRKTITLRPYDPRMWCAVAGCYESIKRPEEAIKCYERADLNKDRDGIALSKLAKLCEELGDHKKAAEYYAENLKRRDEDEGRAGGQETVDALKFLAQYHKEQRNFEHALEMCSRLLDHNGPERMEAQAIQREIHEIYRPQSN